jgi:2-dehydro-3-deoxyphosphogluconate aldolase/(4S)-4-hydroxy-2-oxoglutarate aldolase
VSLDNLGGFLKQPNVALVGGSWLAPAAALQAGDWSQITTLARQAMALSAG